MDALQACNGDTSNAWIDVVGGLSPIRKFVVNSFREPEGAVRLASRQITKALIDQSTPPKAPPPTLNICASS
jgi:hypothetical protein